MQFWEDVFLDAVAQERDIIGLDQDVNNLLDRYIQLSIIEKKRLELDEDRLLSIMLFNLIAFMIMMKVSKDEIKRKIRRLLAKCHIGLQMSQQVNELLEYIHILHANDIDLKPYGNRLLQNQTFTVYNVTNQSNDTIDQLVNNNNNNNLLFIEICLDCLLIRNLKGDLIQRYFYDSIVNMTYCPKTKVLCLWTKNNLATNNANDDTNSENDTINNDSDNQLDLNKYYTKKCKKLYSTIKDCMDKAANRLMLHDLTTTKIISTSSSSSSSTLLNNFNELNEYEIYDFVNSNRKGLMRIQIDGIWLLFSEKNEFINLKHIKKCTTQNNDVFVLEVFNTNKKQIITRKYKSNQVSFKYCSL
jgi:hypothetical protein